MHACLHAGLLDLTTVVYPDKPSTAAAVVPQRAFVMAASNLLMVRYVPRTNQTPGTNFCPVAAFRFVDMDLSNVTSAFRTALCNVTASRILQSLKLSTPANDTNLGTLEPGDLSCTVEASAGSVVAAAAVQVPDTVSEEGIAGAVASLMSSLNDDISSAPALEAFGDTEPVQVSCSSASTQPEHVWHSPVPDLLSPRRLQQAPT